jgi:hypothetical protein
MGFVRDRRDNPGDPVVPAAELALQRGLSRPQLCPLALTLEPELAPAAKRFDAYQAAVAVAATIGMDLAGVMVARSGRSPARRRRAELGSYRPAITGRLAAPADEGERFDPVTGNLDEDGQKRRLHQGGDRWPGRDEGN